MQSPPEESPECECGHLERASNTRLERTLELDLSGAGAALDSELGDDADADARAETTSPQAAQQLDREARARSEKPCAAPACEPPPPPRRRFSGFIRLALISLVRLASLTSFVSMRAERSGSRECGNSHSTFAEHQHQHQRPRDCEPSEADAEV